MTNSLVSLLPISVASCTSQVPDATAISAMRVRFLAEGPPKPGEARNDELWFDIEREDYAKILALFAGWKPDFSTCSHTGLVVLELVDREGARSSVAVCRTAPRQRGVFCIGDRYFLGPPDHEVLSVLGKYRPPSPRAVRQSNHSRRTAESLAVSRSHEI